MSINQSSIYRGIENLLLDLTVVVDRFPKNSQSMQMLSSRLLNELIDSLTAVDHALNTKVYSDRLILIDALVHSLTIVKTIFRTLLERVARDPKLHGVISKSLHGEFLKKMLVISMLTGNWKQSTLLKIEEELRQLAEHN